MTISDAQYTAWLKDNNAVRCILIEAVARVSGSETMFYISNRGYANGSTVYKPVLIGSSVRMVESLSIDQGGGSYSIGDIEIDNTGGDLDAWFYYIWVNRAITALVGDVRWPRSDFRAIFNGINIDIGSRTRDKINFRIRDKMERLNTPVTETTLGGTTNNKNELIPLTFGEPHNISLLSTNPATLEYQFHGGTCERSIEVRDNGVPVTATANLTTGKVVLAASPYARITGTFQGDKSAGVYNNTAKKIIQRLVTAYGQSAQRLSTGDLDSSNLSAFDAANTQALGIYLSGRETVKNVCDQAAASVGAQMIFSRAGLLKLIKIALPAAGTVYDIERNHIVAGSLFIKSKLDIQSAFKIGFCKNWTVQEGLDTRIPAAHKDLFGREWLSYTASDTTTKTNYRLLAEPELKETYLLTEANATTEANRLLALYKEPRFIVAFEAFAPLMELELGQPVTLPYPRYGMDAGVDGLVVGLSPDWGSFRVGVEVLI